PPSGLRQMELFPMSSAEDSPARILAAPERVSALTASAAGFGKNTPVLLAKFDRATSSWKIPAISLFGVSEEFSATWPRSGMTRSGIAFRLPPLVPIIGEIV